MELKEMASKSDLNWKSGLTTCYSKNLGYLLICLSLGFLTCKLGANGDSYHIKYCKDHIKAKVPWSGQCLAHRRNVVNIYYLSQTYLICHALNCMFHLVL